MIRITKDDYNKYVSINNNVMIESNIIKIGKKIKIDELNPENFKLEIGNVWSFPDRGKWCTHYMNSAYRGNYAPQIPRNIILRYSKEDDYVLDPFSGSGTTLIETKLLKRHGIGIDINIGSLMISMDRLNFDFNNLYEPELYNGDARNLNKIYDETIDLIITHPPYANIISYSKNNILNDDLSSINSIDDYLIEIKKVANELFRVLKKNRYCAILIGDLRKNKHHIPLSFYLMSIFLNAGFILKEDIIKIQHNTKTRSYWEKASIEKNFLLLSYEHLFVFRKPDNENNSKYKYSMK